jgi:hypothetical protein
MKREVLALTLISVMMLAAVVGTFFVNYALANPYFPGEETAPPEGTTPPTIAIRSPKEQTYGANSLLLSFTVRVGSTQPIPNALYGSEVSTRISDVRYEADWIGENITVYPPPTDTRISVEFSGELDNIPQGRHSIVIYATESGYYEGGLVSPGGVYVYQNSFKIRQSWEITFTIDLPPRISILSLENKTYSTSDARLDFFVNEPVSAVAYSLDGNENVTVSGNTTLTGLANGYHNVTVYATDEDGNTGASKTIYFNVEVHETFPTTLVTASVFFVGVVGVGFFIYLKKRKDSEDTQ